MKKCDLCHKPDKTHYRVKSIIHKNWIFCCKECWNLISTYKNSKKLFIINFIPNKIYCLAGYWIEEVSPGKFEAIFYEKTKQKINEYKNTKKEVDELIKGINLEYKSIKKEINDFF